MTLGRMTIFGWLIGATTRYVQTQYSIEEQDFLWLGVDLYTTLANHELKLPQATVLVAAEKGAFNMPEHRLIQTVEWLRYTGSWAQLRTPGPNTSVKAAANAARRARQRIVDPVVQWLHRLPSPDARWPARYQRLKQIHSDYLEGASNFDQLQAQQARLIRGNYPRLQHSFARVQHHQQQVAVRVNRELDAVLPRLDVFTHLNHGKIELPLPRILTAAPTVDYLQLNSACYRHDLVAALARQQAARLHSGQPLMTETTRPFRGGAVWQSDGTLAPPSKKAPESAP